MKIGTISANNVSSVMLLCLGLRRPITHQMIHGFPANVEVFLLPLTFEMIVGPATKS
jgi:hypothetical protein